MKDSLPDYNKRKFCLGQNLKYIRQLHNYNQDDFAVEFGISKRTLQNYESCKSIEDAAVALSFIMKICDMYNISVETLTYEDMSNIVINKDNLSGDNETCSGELSEQTRSKSELQDESTISFGKSSKSVNLSNGFTKTTPEFIERSPYDSNRYSEIMGNFRHSEMLSKEMFAQDTDNIKCRDSLTVKGIPVKLEEDTKHSEKSDVKKIGHKSLITILSIILFFILFMTSSSAFMEQGGSYDDNKGNFIEAGANVNYGDENFVYVTKSGERYHKSDCRFVKNNKNVIKLKKEEAIQKNYTPCKVCNPDED